MPTFRQITIIGTGLIGGSFALAVKANGFPGKIVGCDRKPILTKAKRIGAIDVAIADPIAACKNSDLVLLATPVGGIVELIEKLGQHLSPETLLTDVGSTKSTIVRAAQESFGGQVSRRFIGGHPMAGKEHSGIEHADAKLFKGAVWFLTLTRGQKPKTGSRIADFSALIGKLGVKIISLDAAEHDRLCAWISHVPQMISTALASALVEEYGENAPLLEAGGRALREMTRIASSSYSMWRDIAITNKQPISDALLKFEQAVAHIRENLDTRELEQEFNRAHKLNHRSTKKNQLRSHG
jgi:prephenate dehydrogenase